MLMEKKSFLLPEKIDSLQALRFLGAMCITVYHFAGLQGNCPADFSTAVYLFYMISGFVVMLSTRKPEKKRCFLTRRLIRILPLYWGLTVFTYVAGLYFPSILGYKPTLTQLIKSMFFIPFDRATAKAGTALRPLVGLGHTLQMEMLFYLLFLIAMRVSHKYRGFLAAVFAGAVALTGVFFPTENPVIHFYTANPYVWTSFIIGLTVYGLFSLLQKMELQAPCGILSVGAVLISLAAVVPVFVRETSVWYTIMMFAAVFCAGLVWSACGRKTPRLLVVFGNISYSYYLLHYYTVTMSARFLGIDTFSFRNVALAIMVSAATWGISWVSWYLIENKLTRNLQRKMIR